MGDSGNAPDHAACSQGAFFGDMCLGGDDHSALAGAVLSQIYIVGDDAVLMDLYTGSHRDICHDVAVGVNNDRITILNMRTDLGEFPYCAALMNHDGIVTVA